MNYHLTLVALLATSIAFKGESACNFHQLREFSRSSSCYNRIYDLLKTFLSANRSIDEAKAQLFCTQDCAGNFITFLRNDWHCRKKEFKNLYIRILTSLCSRNKEGKRCINMLRPSPEDKWTNSTASCSQEHHSHLQRLLDKYGCCFELTFGARIKPEPQRYCDIHSPPVCLPDYALQTTAAIEGLSPSNRASVADRSPDSFNSDTKTSLSQSNLVLFVLVSLFAVLS